MAKQHGIVHPTSGEDDFDSQWQAILNESNPNVLPKTSEAPQLPLPQVELTESSESETDEENENPDDISLGDINLKLNTLLLQMEEIRKKYLKEAELKRRAELSNKDLLVKIADLEEENVEYQGTSPLQSRAD
jgi:hypothetical protein